MQGSEKGSILCNLTLHFCQKLFPRFELMIFGAQKKLKREQEQKKDAQEKSFLFVSQSESDICIGARLNLDLRIAWLIFVGGTHMGRNFFHSRGLELIPD